MLQAVPCSLATTYGISVDFFSCSYLDVSVRCVRSTLPMYSGGSTLAGGFPHSDIHGSKLACQLPVAFRRLLRPSSPVIAKASTTCTYSLDPITLSSAPSVNLGQSLGHSLFACDRTPPLVSRGVRSIQSQPMSGTSFFPAAPKTRARASLGPTHFTSSKFLKIKQTVTLNE